MSAQECCQGACREEILAIAEKLKQSGKVSKKSRFDVSHDRQPRFWRLRRFVLLQCPHGHPFYLRKARR